MIHLIYSLLCVLLPCFIYQRIAIRRSQGQKNAASHRIWVFVFWIYVWMALFVAGVGSVWDIGQYNEIIRTEEINLIPFQSEGMMTYILNLIMFLPLGFLLPLIWKTYRTPVKVLFTGAGFSLAIEICQLFNHRNTDVDDLLMNTAGAVLGYMIWMLFQKNFGKKESGILSRYEPVWYLLLAVLGEFFLYNWRLFTVFGVN